MNVPVNPSSVPSPLGGYSHAIESARPDRWLHISGQIGAGHDGIRHGIEAQTKQCWQNITSILNESGMDLSDLVKVTMYVTSTEDVDPVRVVRDRVLGDLKPASTILVVSALPSPDFLVEIEAIAASDLSST